MTANMKFVRFTTSLLMNIYDIYLFMVLFIIYTYRYICICIHTYKYIFLMSLSSKPMHFHVHIYICIYIYTCKCIRSKCTRHNCRALCVKCPTFNTNNMFTYSNILLLFEHVNKYVHIFDPDKLHRPFFEISFGIYTKIFMRIQPSKRLEPLGIT